MALIEHTRWRSEAALKLPPCETINRVPFFKSRSQQLNCFLHPFILGRYFIDILDIMSNEAYANLKAPPQISFSRSLASVHRLHRIVCLQLVLHNP